MTKIVRYFISFTIMFQFCNLGYGGRTKDKMYEQIYNTTGCYRRLNATHQIGCSSLGGGSRGVVHYCDTLDDLDFILTNGTASPYIPILSTKNFNYNVVQKLNNSEQISGLILYQSSEALDHFTHEYQCPNPSSSFPGSCTKNTIWNPFGTGLLYTDIPFPVFYLENIEELEKIKACFEKFNNFSYETHPDRSLCSLELDAVMYATTNTPTCLRRYNIVSDLQKIKFCDPLGDSNIWASLYPVVEGDRNETKSITNVKYIVISARIDTTSMFDKTSSANNPVTGIISLLSIAKFLKENLSEEDLRKANKNILFILFNGETYDYIGSQRMLYDMLNGNFPVEGLEENNGILPLIHPDNISLFIELSQLGNNRDNVYIHYLEEQPEINNFYSKLINNNRTYPKFERVVNSLPPASLHTFLKEIKTFPGLIISDHKHSYSNHYYNSIYDNAINIGFKYYSNLTKDKSTNIPKNSVQTFIANLTEIIGESIYETVTGHKLADRTKVDVVLINELFFCYLEDPNCKILSATQIRKLPNMPMSLYVGIDRVASYSTIFTALALGWFVGDIVGEGDISCTNKPRNHAFEYYNMSKSIYELNVTKCFKITMNTTEAKSPAFIIPDYDWSNGKYSSWTESTWDEMKVTLFVKPSSAHEKMTIAIGSMSLIFSFIVVYFLKSRSHILFTPPLPTEAPTDC